MLINVTDKAPTSKNAINIIRNTWAPIFGCPRSILTDRGLISMSQEFKDYIINELQIKLYHTSAYYPQGNGINESSHKSLDYILKTLYEKKELHFEQIVKNVILIYNNTHHGAIGETPYFSIYGIDCIRPDFSKITPKTTKEMKIIYLNDLCKNENEDLIKIKEKSLRIKSLK